MSSVQGCSRWASCAAHDECNCSLSRNRSFRRRRSGLPVAHSSRLFAVSFVFVPAALPSMCVSTFNRVHGIFHFISIELRHHIVCKQVNEIQNNGCAQIVTLRCAYCIRYLLNTRSHVDICWDRKGWTCLWEQGSENPIQCQQGNLR